MENQEKIVRYFSVRSVDVRGIQRDICIWCASSELERMLPGMWGRGETGCECLGAFERTDNGVLEWLRTEHSRPKD